MSVSRAMAHTCGRSGRRVAVKDLYLHRALDTTVHTELIHHDTLKDCFQRMFMCVTVCYNARSPPAQLSHDLA